MQNLWQKIKQGAQAVGDFQARLILSLLYYLLVLPIGLISRLAGETLTSRSLGRPAVSGSHWQIRKETPPRLRDAHRQH